MRNLTVVVVFRLSRNARYGLDLERFRSLRVFRSLVASPGMDRTSECTPSRFTHGHVHQSALAKPSAFTVHVPSRGTPGNGCPPRRRPTPPPRSIAVAASSAPLPGVQTGKKASEQCPLAR